MQQLMSVGTSDEQLVPSAQLQYQGMGMICKTPVQAARE